MTDERCELTDLVRAECSHCLKQKRHSWPAMYLTVCPTCNQPIEPGTVVQWTEDGLYVEHARHR